MLTGRLRLPLIAAPMFLASGPELVLACCRAGIIGSFPAKNQRTREGLDDWLTEIDEGLGAIEAETGRPPPPSVYMTTGSARRPASSQSRSSLR